MVLTEQTLKEISKSISCDFKEKTEQTEFVGHGKESNVLPDYHVKIQYLKIITSPDTYKEKKSSKWVFSKTRGQALLVIPDI